LGQFWRRFELLIVIINKFKFARLLATDLCWKATGIPAVTPLETAQWPAASGWKSDLVTLTSLSGRPFRHYNAALTTSLGYRYADEAFGGRTNFPALDVVSLVRYTQRLPALGHAMDEAL
jgi:hypothetical protein